MLVQYNSSLFPNYLPFQMVLSLHLNKLEIPCPKNALCRVWLKTDQRFWRRKGLRQLRRGSAYVYMCYIRGPCNHVMDCMCLCLSTMLDRVLHVHLLIFLSFANSALFELTDVLKKGYRYSVYQFSPVLPVFFCAYIIRKHESYLCSSKDYNH